MKEYWWAVLLMSVAFVLFMGVFIKCCAVHTPSSNPKKPPALSITQTLRHPYSTLRRKRHHHPPQQPAPSAPYIAAPNPGDGPSYNNHGEGRNHYSRPKGRYCLYYFIRTFEKALENSTVEYDLCYTYLFIYLWWKSYKSFYWFRRSSKWMG